MKISLNKVFIFPFENSYFSLTCQDRFWQVDIYLPLLIMSSLPTGIINVQLEVELQCTIYIHIA